MYSFIITCVHIHVHYIYMYITCINAHYMYMCTRIITRVSCPVPMASLLLLKDGITMIGGGSDGMLPSHYY